MIYKLGIRPDCFSLLEFLPLRTGDSWATHPSWFAPSFLHRKPLDHREGNVISAWMCPLWPTLWEREDGLCSRHMLASSRFRHSFLQSCLDSYEVFSVHTASACPGLHDALP